MFLLLFWNMLFACTLILKIFMMPIVVYCIDMIWIMMRVVQIVNL